MIDSNERATFSAWTAWTAWSGRSAWTASRARPAWQAWRCLAAACAAGFALVSASSLAFAQEGPNPFGCRGQADALIEGLSTDDIEQERDKRMDEGAAEGESPEDLAQRMCVVAKLMARVGDSRASHYFEKAIAANPSEGGYELWYGDYLGRNRGSAYPLVEDAERHLYRALDKVRARKAAGREASFDAITEEWAQRRLINLYQADGFPVLPWKGYPYDSTSVQAPGLFLAAEGRASVDTNDFLDVSDVRNFTSEMLFAGSAERLNRSLTYKEKQSLAIAPVRYGYVARARLRQNVLGAVDFVYKSLQIEQGQIVRYDQPTVFGNAQVQEYGVSYKRGFDLYPLFDATVEASYRRVDRLGLVEYFPDQWEHIGLTELKPSVSRFLGPDVLTVGMNYVYMDISSVQGGELDQRKRARGITGVYFDYAIYRPLLLPQTGESLRIRRQGTRGLHLFGGAAYDNEVFGTRLVEKRDYYGGVSLLGIGPFDLTAQGTLFQGGAVDQLPYDLRKLSNAQWRTTLVPQIRVIDVEAMPGMPHGEAPVFLNLVFPMRQDVATQGPPDFDNVRVGAELWTRIVSPHLRGTSFLVSGGYAFQYFYNLDKPLNTARIDVAMGW